MVSYMKKILSYINLKGLKKQFIGYILFSLLICIVSTIVPYITGVYIDNLLEYRAKSVIYVFSIIVLIVNVLNILGNYFLNLCSAKLNTNLSFNLSNGIYEHLKRAPLSYFSEVDSAYLVSKISDDSNTVVSFFLENCVEFFAQIITILISIYILCTIDFLLGVIIIFVIPLYILIYKYYRKKVFQANYEFKESQNVFFSKMTEQFSMIKYLKLQSLFNFFSRRLVKSFDALYDKLIINVKINYLFNNLNMIITLIINIVIIAYSGYKIISGNMSIGAFTMLNSYFSNLVVAATYYMGVGSTYQQALASVHRLEEVKNIREENNGKIRIKSIDSIALNNVTFSYCAKEVLFKDITLELRKGLIYCIRGGNGAGKTSFINLIVGMNQNEYTGEILYNGIRLEDLDMYYLRKEKIAICEQEPQLFNSSIKENILLGAELKENVLDYWCKELHFEEKIHNLEESYDTIVSEGAKNLSGGEKQKISIIRTLIKKADLLIFDEATSALDSKSINLFLKIIERLKENKIIIIITHKSELINKADRVIDLEKYKE